MVDNSLFVSAIALRDDIDPGLFGDYPLNIPAFRNFVSMRIPGPILILNGENGCGKSTIIEAIADQLGMPISGGNRNLGAIIENYDIGEEESSALSQYLRISKGYRRPKRSFFFRAESFYKIADIIAHDSQRSHDYTIDPSNYGDRELLGQSHGESFLDFLQHQFCEDGLFILDEPEAALSPQNQMVLVALIDRFAKEGAQFIIATHSPFILGYSKATIVNLDDGIRVVKFKDTKIYNLYSHFLADPEGYQKLFLADD